MATPAVPSPATTLPRDLELIDYFGAILERRRLVATLAVGLAVAAALVSLLSPRQYEAAALLSVMPARLESGALMETTPDTMVPVVKSITLLNGAIVGLKLDQPPYGLTAQRFLANHVVAEPILRTSFLEVRVTLPDADLARRAADEIVARAVDQARRMNLEEAGGLEARLEQIARESQRRFLAAEQALKDFRSRSQIELLRKDVEAKLGQRGAFLQLQVDISAERGRVARAEEEIRQRAPRETTVESITRGRATLSEAARTGTGEDPTGLIGLSVQSEQVNAARSELDVQVGKARAKLAALEKQRERMLELAQVNETQLPQLTTLYEREAQLTRLQVDFDVSRKAFEEAATSYQIARTRTALRSPFVQVVDKAARPNAPQSRHVARNAAVALVGGTMLGCLVALGTLALTRIALRPGQPSRR
jgi:uncharacterized protein involved in exopolysaccharide biosynthesis